MTWDKFNDAMSANDKRFKKVEERLQNVEVTLGNVKTGLVDVRKDLGDVRKDLGDVTTGLVKLNEGIKFFYDEQEKKNLNFMNFMKNVNSTLS